VSAFPSAPAGSAMAALFDSLLAAGAQYAGATSGGGRFSCPTHDDEHPSLDVALGVKGPLFTCTPCTLNGRAEWLAELRSLGVQWSGKPCTEADIDWGPSAPATAKGSGSGKAGAGGGRLTAVYQYRTEDDKENYKVSRFEGEGGSKTFRISHWTGTGWASGLGGAERTPYGLERFERWARSGKGVVYLVEGEKATEALWAANKAATTFPGGAQGALPDDWAARFFSAFREVRIWPDADEAGVLRARQLADGLRSAGVAFSFWGVPASVGVQPKDDAYDLLERALAPRKLSAAHLDALAALHPLPTRASRASRTEPTPEKSHGTFGGKALYGAGSGGPPKSPPGAPGVSVNEPEEGAVGSQTNPYPVKLGVEPVQFVRAYVDAHLRDAEGRLLLRHHPTEEVFRLWSPDVVHYVDLVDGDIDRWLARDLVGSFEVGPDGQVTPIRLTTRLVTEFRKRLAAECYVGRDAVNSTDRMLSVAGGIQFANGWLDVASRALTPTTPERDVRWSVAVDWDRQNHGTPSWFAFLDSVGFTKSSEERLLLREWMGYLLSGSTEQQKLLCLFGPTRCGKGTILRVCEAMFGTGADATQIDTLTESFGLANFVGKSLITIGDARFGYKENSGDKRFIERILSITGGDTISVNRKHKDAVRERITGRLMVATNEIPHVLDNTTALNGRVLFLPFTKSFLDNEDRKLEDKLRAELPGIVHWALGGLDSLEERGYFLSTEKGREVSAEMLRNSAPVREFIEECCEFDDAGWVALQDLYDAYRAWASRTNAHPLTRVWLGRDVASAYPETSPKVRKVQGHVIRGRQGIRLRP
jgi:P4 family phage/plasmid primase-like protien